MESADRGKKKEQLGNTHQGKEKGPSGKRFGARQRGDDDLVRALDHRMRREIMRLLHTPETPLSTHEIAEGLGQTLARTRHHMQILRRRGLIALVAADADVETFYVSRIKDQAAVAVFLEQADETSSAA